METPREPVSVNLSTLSLDEVDRLQTADGQSTDGPLICKETTIDGQVYKLWQVGSQNVCSPIINSQDADPLKSACLQTHYKVRRFRLQARVANEIGSS